MLVQGSFTAVATGIRLCGRLLASGIHSALCSCIESPFLSAPTLQRAQVSFDTQVYGLAAIMVAYTYQAKGLHLGVLLAISNLEAQCLGNYTCVES